MAEHDYPIVVSALAEEDGGGFMAIAPDLKGCMADGATIEAAIADLRNAIGEWIDEAARLNREVPQPGASARQTRERHKKIDTLIKSQDELIKKQEDHLKVLRAEVDRLHEDVAHLIGPEPKDKPLHLGWAFDPVRANYVG